MNAIDSQLKRLADEPFRMFFPLGILASVAGVLLWPAYFWKWFPYYPLEVHARWMVLGFGGCFIVGFLGTAGPRLLGARTFTRGELLLHVAFALAMMAALAFNRVKAADLFCGIWLTGVLVSLLGRFVRGRKDTPPPGTILIVAGVAGGAAAGFILGLGLSLPSGLRLFFRLLYFQGFLWLPILGIGPYLLPRILGTVSSHAFEESLRAPAGWRRRFFEAAAVGTLMVLSFALEALGYARLGMGLRAMVVGGYLIWAVSGLMRPVRTHGLGWALRWVVPLSVVGWLLAVRFPYLRVGMLHAMFIGGVGLLILSVATRVALGHTDQQDRLAGPMRWCHGLWFLVLVILSARLSADFMPGARISHLGYAAALWLVILLFWAWKLRRKTRQPSLGGG